MHLIGHGKVVYRAVLKNKQFLAPIVYPECAYQVRGSRFINAAQQMHCSGNHRDMKLFRIAAKRGYIVGAPKISNADMKAFTELICETCASCNICRSNRPTPDPRGTKRTDTPGQCIYVDMVQCKPRSCKGHGWILHRLIE